MALPECPKCHATAKLAGNLPYCASCGWNRDAAIRALRGNLKMMPVGIAVFGLFIVFVLRGWHFRNPTQIAIFLGAPPVAFLLNYIFMSRNLAKLEAMPAPAMAPKDDSARGAAEVEPTPEASAQYQALLRSSRPREIRMSSQGKFGVIAGLLMAVGFAVAIGFNLHTKWALHQSFVRFQTSDWAMGGFGALLALLPFGIWRGQKKECDLLENGDVVLAKVTRQWRNQNSSYIECEFKDFAGQVHTITGPDNTRKLFQGMSVPVFYDRENPKRAMAGSSTLHEVVT